MLLQQTGIVFLFAPTFHPGFKRLAAARKALGKRTIFNLLGPLCNPARVQRQLIGVFSPGLCDLVAETCRLLERDQVIVVHGRDGGDELSITTPTDAVCLADGQITRQVFHPPDAIAKPPSPDELKGGDAAYNANALQDLLAGKKGAYRDTVLMNCAALLMVADQANTIGDGITLAQTAIDDGRATDKLAQLVKASRD